MRRKMKKISFYNKVFLALLVGLVFIFFSFRSRFFEIAKQIEIYNSLFKELNMYYVEEINPAELTDKAIKNTLKGLDPYTNFYTEQDVEKARMFQESEYVGIGASVFYTKEGILLSEIYKGFPADNSGLKTGDLIVSVDGQSLVNLETNQLSSFLKGAANSNFVIKIKRQNRILEKEITREKIILKSVPFAKIIDDDIGYISLVRFSEKASAEVKKTFKKLKKEGMKKLILDLRSNPGGSLMESVKISNFFLPKGKVVINTKAKVKKWSNTYKTRKSPLDAKIPVVVLINESSASASEIVSGSLQDYDRAVIMGQRSFGKGLVQRFRKLPYGTQLKMSISKYYTPSGRCIQELDYSNRDNAGKVLKFSDNIVNEFKTKNGRTVYDGGGILPDVVLKTTAKTEATKKLLESKAIFNFATKYYYQNSKIAEAENFTFKNSEFKNFISYLKTDTTFVTKQEKLFKTAYKSSKEKGIDKEYEKIKEKLLREKIKNVSLNKDILITKIREEIISRYYYKEGVFQHNLKNDTAIKNAFNLLQNDENYKNILSVK